MKPPPYRQMPDDFSPATKVADGLIFAQYDDPDAKPYPVPLLSMAAPVDKKADLLHALWLSAEIWRLGHQKGESSK